MDHGSSILAPLKHYTKDGLTLGSGSKKLEVQNPPQPEMDLTFRLKIGPTLEDWFLKLEVLFFSG